MLYTETNIMLYVKKKKKKISPRQDYITCRPRAKWKYITPCSKIIKTFKTAIAEHEIKAGPCQAQGLVCLSRSQAHEAGSGPRLSILFSHRIPLEPCTAHLGSKGFMYASAVHSRLWASCEKELILVWPRRCVATLEHWISAQWIPKSMGLYWQILNLDFASAVWNQQVALLSSQALSIYS